MTMKQRLLALGLSLSMTITLVACTNQNSQESESADPSASPSATTSAEPSPTPSEEIVADLNQDIWEFSAGLTDHTPMLTVNGQGVSNDLFLYWTAVNCAYFENAYQVSANDYADDLKEDSRDVAAYYTLLKQKCEELACPLTDEQQTAVQETLMADGQDMYERSKTINGLSDETMQFIYATKYYEENLMAATVADPTDEQILELVYQTRHILISTVDENGNALSDEEKEEKKAKAEELLAQLRASDDVSNLFNELMNANSEDPGLESNPNGYTATLGQMVSEYETAALALQVGEVSDVVESSYGYHIIIRDTVPNPQDYATQWKSYTFSNQMDAWLKEADIQTTENYENLNVADFYHRFIAYQTALADTLEPLESASTESAAGESAPAESTAPSDSAGE